MKAPLPRKPPSPPAPRRLQHDRRQRRRRRFVGRRRRPRPRRPPLRPPISSFSASANGRAARSGGPSAIWGVTVETVTDGRPAAPSPAPPVEWGLDGAPRVAPFDDVYFSSEGGLAETRAVFLAGCGLPAPGAGAPIHRGRAGVRHRAEHPRPARPLARAAPAGARLHIFSVEAFPCRPRTPPAPWRPGPSSPTSPRLIARWPRRARGFHRIDLPGLGATLDLAVMDVGEAPGGLERRGRRLVPRRLLAGLQSGDVARRRCMPPSPSDPRRAPRRHLHRRRRMCAAAWPRPASRRPRRPASARKRERLEARLPGERRPTPRRPRWPIVGAGHRRRGPGPGLRGAGRDHPCRGRRPGAGASGNPAAWSCPGSTPAAGRWPSSTPRPSPARPTSMAGCRKR